MIENTMWCPNCNEGEELKNISDGNIKCRTCGYIGKPNCLTNPSSTELVTSEEDINELVDCVTDKSHQTTGIGFFSAGSVDIINLINENEGLLKYDSYGSFIFIIWNGENTQKVIDLLKKGDVFHAFILNHNHWSYSQEDTLKRISGLIQYWNNHTSSITYHKVKNQQIELNKKHVECMEGMGVYSTKDINDFMHPIYLLNRIYKNKEITKRDMGELKKLIPDNAEGIKLIENFKSDVCRDFFHHGHLGYDEYLDTHLPIYNMLIKNLPENIKKIISGGTDSYSYSYEEEWGKRMNQNVHRIDTEFMLNQLKGLRQYARLLIDIEKN